MRNKKKAALLILTCAVLCGASPDAVWAVAATSENMQTVLSDDNSLSSITLSAGKISPALQAGVTQYTAEVPNEVTEVEVKAETTNAAAAVTEISGNTDLAEGENLIRIVVTAENGAEATYKITVTRAAATAQSTSTADAQEEDDIMLISETGETEEAADTETDATAAEAYDALKIKYDHLHETYETRVKADQSRIYGLTGACVALAAVSLFLFVRLRKKKAEDALWDEDGDWDEDSRYEDWDGEEEGDWDEDDRYENGDPDEDDRSEAEERDENEQYESEDWDTDAQYDDRVPEEIDAYEEEESEDLQEKEAEDFGEDTFPEAEARTRKKRERMTGKKHARREQTEDELEVMDLNDL